MSIFEYDEEKHMKSERAEWREIGYREGHEDGLAKGTRTGGDNLASLLKSLMDDGKSEEVNRVLTDSDYRQKLLQEYFPEEKCSV